jgi:hypothetical protein
VAPLLDDVWAFLRTRPGLRTKGHNLMLYTKGFHDADVGVEVGVQVTESFEAVGRVVPSTFRDQGLCIVFAVTCSCCGMRELTLTDTTGKRVRIRHGAG